jgi:hypothetical protein
MQRDFLVMQKLNAILVILRDMSERLEALEKARTPATTENDLTTESRARGRDESACSQEKSTSC